MSLTAQQLETLQTDVANLTAAVQADTTAEAAVTAAEAALAQAQATLASAQGTATITSAAVQTAGAQLEADAQADFPPTASPLPAPSRN